MLDAVVEIANHHGYPGAIWQAERLLRLADGFTIETSPSGRAVVCRAAP